MEVQTPPLLEFMSLEPIPQTTARSHVVAVVNSKSGRRNQVCRGHSLLTKDGCTNKFGTHEAKAVKSSDDDSNFFLLASASPAVRRVPAVLSTNLTIRSLIVSIGTDTYGGLKRKTQETIIVIILNNFSRDDITESYLPRRLVWARNDEHLIPPLLKSMSILEIRSTVVVNSKSGRRDQVRRWNILLTKDDVRQPCKRYNPSFEKSPSGSNPDFNPPILDRLDWNGYVWWVKKKGLNMSA
ncbi:hypothetical protein V2J09_014601 [Rumex salicifolius]